MGLEHANPPIIPSAEMSAFLLSTVDGYTEILLEHRELLRHLIEVQLEAEQDPFLSADRIIGVVEECMTSLRDAYAGYFADLADRRYVLNKTMRENSAFRQFVQAWISPSYLISVLLNVLNEGSQPGFTSKLGPFGAQRHI